MVDENDGPKDWEVKDEDPPEELKRKWVEREHFGKRTVECPACKKAVPSESVSCLFCGAGIPHDTGLLGKVLRWLKGAK